MYRKLESKKILKRCCFLFHFLNHEHQLNFQFHGKNAYEAASVVKGSHIPHQLFLRKITAYLNGCHCNILYIKIQLQSIF